MQLFSNFPSNNMKIFFGLVFQTSMKISLPVIIDLKKLKIRPVPPKKRTLNVLFLSTGKNQEADFRQNSLQRPAHRRLNQATRIINSYFCSTHFRDLSGIIIVTLKQHGQISDINKRHHHSRRLGPGRQDPENCRCNI